MSIEKELYDQLTKRILMYHPTKDFSVLENAYNFAVDAHINQKRRSGEPYIIHPLKVAYILADLELDMETIIAGILHDTIEDTPFTYDDIERIFGEEIAALVDGVTKLGHLSYAASQSKEEIQAENYRKMFMAMAKDIRVLLVKLADRLHNMRTLEFMPPEKQKEKAQETIDIYAPLADRLGISKIKTELEDLSFKYLYPEEYKDIVQKIELKKEQRLTYVNTIVKQVSEKMSENSIKGEVYGRNKHLFSIFKKMRNKHKQFDEIYDLFAVRAIVNTVGDCYAVLGIVHDMYKPMPGRFKDYIAMPKPNMYQSLHNTLIGPTGEPFEIQIRTYEMQKTSEYGIAAHWKYKEGKSGLTTAKEEEKLSWLRRILEWQQNMSDNKEFMDTVKTELNIYTDHVYAFTPQGDVISLPAGATPIDFAYMIHSAVGNKMVGARVNGKIVTFDYQVKNGDRIEIITSQNSKGPSKDWLSLVKSSQAKTKINQWFKKEFKEENIIKGKELLTSDAKRKGYAISELMKPDWIEVVCRKFTSKNWDALCSAVGYGGLKEGQVINRLIEEKKNEENKNQTAADIIKKMEQNAMKKSASGKNGSGVIVKGAGDVAVKFSHCCNPVPGDDIIGFVTRGRGVTIHRTDCINILNLNEMERHRLIDAEWDKNAQSLPNVSYTTELKLVCDDRVGLVMDVSRVLSDENMPVKSFNARSLKDGTAIVEVTIDIKSKDQLEKIVVKFKNIQGVDEIQRVSG
ncbi:MAG: bifunctional (p)ppGpp synthetase/guanosine-3',5'-bis(diphosphate) 3'-pyrophosphohydrolase [Clostridia bacterium]|nr:bifunctional (p)ppGpp synthetase/guanosine-3',5'-bis(diphosphate) 3'-pyrophosphohydrolase [Clostridia bacterium]MCI2015380.1 bifunctional (p)ppGpp synthetase/guanosine-3',5'-bis(diphosphate) 3'-pyrophosphohydrolase [Clostridia bacterium]